MSAYIPTLYCPPKPDKKGYARFTEILAQIIEDDSFDIENGAVALEDAVKDFEINVRRKHIYGEGNALHQAICRHPSELQQFVFDVLIAQGARLDQACEDIPLQKNGKGYQFDTLYDWLVEGHYNEDMCGAGWVMNTILPGLLCAGADMGPLSQRDDDIGKMIRAHPMWKRPRLAELAEQMRPSDQKAATRTPKL